MTDTRTLLAHTADLASGYLESLDRRPVSGPVDLAALRDALGGPLPDAGEDPLATADWWRRRPTQGWSARPVRATSGSSSAAAYRPRWRPIG